MRQRGSPKGYPKGKLLFSYPVDLQFVFTFPRFHRLLSLLFIDGRYQFREDKLGRAKLGLPLGDYIVNYLCIAINDHFYFMPQENCAKMNKNGFLTSP